MSGWRDELRALAASCKTKGCLSPTPRIPNSAISSPCSRLESDPLPFARVRARLPGGDRGSRTPAWEYHGVWLPNTGGTQGSRRG